MIKKIITFFFISSLVFGCSFDKNSKIWTGTEKTSIKNKDNTNLKPVFEKKRENLPITSLISKDNLIIQKPENFKSWKQRYLNNKNNIGNLKFLNNGSIEKLSKISRHQINKNFLISGDNLISSDTKGNIIVFSLTKNKSIFKYNFYQKKFKKINKDLKIILNKEIVIVADNLGYLYAIDYQNNKLKWAKNFLVPFRSNLKLADNILFLADEKNKIILVDITNGEKLDELYTQPAKIVSNFESNFALDDNNDLFFLSTNGNLYALNLINNKIIKWVINLNTENDVSFNSKPLIIQNDKILIPTAKKIYLYSTKGQKNWEIDLESNTKPIISGNVIILVSKDNHLVLIDIDTGKILFSDKITTMISKTFDKKFNKKVKSIENIFLFDKRLLLISNSGYFLELELDRNITINSIIKKPYIIGSDILIVNNKMLIISKKKRLYSNY